MYLILLYCVYFGNYALQVSAMFLVVSSFLNYNYNYNYKFKYNYNYNYKYKHKYNYSYNYK